MPALISVCLFQFMWTMNDFLGPLIYLSSVDKYPVSLALKLSIDTTEAFEWNRILAMSVLALAPALVVFFVAQKILHRRHLLRGDQGLEHGTHSDCRNLEKIYGNGFKAVHGIDLDVDDGEFMVLVGPSGCAKSTTLRMIAGLETITGGEVVIGDSVVNDLPPGKRGIAMVFQNYALYPHMKVRDNLAFGLQARRQAEGRRSRSRIDEVAEHPRDRARCSTGCPSSSRAARPSAWRVGRALIKKPGRLPVRRAAVEPRRQAARLDARAHHRPAPPAEGGGPSGDRRLRDPRPDRGHDHGRPHLRHEGGPHHAGRRPGDALRAAGERLRRRLHRHARR